MKFQRVIIKISKTASITKTNKNYNYRIKVFSNAIIHARRSTLETADQIYIIFVGYSFTAFFWLKTIAY